MPETWPEGRREAVCAWLRANGIDPNHIPRDADLHLEPNPDGVLRIHYEAFHLTADGRRHLDEHGHGPAIERRSAPLLVDPPDWWEPYRKPTRNQLLDAVKRIHVLHRRNENSGACEHCSERDYPDYEVPWPCPTIRALSDGVAP